MEGADEPAGISIAHRGGDITYRQAGAFQQLQAQRLAYGIDWLSSIGTMVSIVKRSPNWRFIDASSLRRRKFSERALIRYVAAPAARLRLLFDDLAAELAIALRLGSRQAASQGANPRG